MPLHKGYSEQTIPNEINWRTRSPTFFSGDPIFISRFLRTVGALSISIESTN
jgi:hypothetical protein